MKAEVKLNENGWMSIDLTAETPREAGLLVKLGMNADAKTRKVVRVHAGDYGVVAAIRFHYRSDRMWDNAFRAVNLVRPVDRE